MLRSIAKISALIAVMTAGASPLFADPAPNPCIACQNACYKRFANDMEKYGACKVDCKGKDICLKKH